jgi:hypothetical protein
MSRSYVSLSKQLPSVSDPPRESPSNDECTAAGSRWGLRRPTAARMAAIAGLLLAHMAYTTEACAFRTAAELPSIGSATPVRWPGGNFVYVVFNQAPGGLLFEEYAQTIEDTLLKWTQPACTSFSARYFGPTGNPAQPNDGVNTIEWIQRSWAARGFDPSAPGQADVLYEQTPSGEWTIKEADIYLNGESNGWTLIGDASSAKWSVEATLVHEGGHAAGLEHPCGIARDGITPSCDSSAQFNGVAMNPIYNPGLSALSEDDQAGICAIYPKGLCGSEVCTEAETCTPTGCRLACGTASCDRDQVCDGHRCVDVQPESDVAKPLGARCSDSAECDRGLVCAADVCTGGIAKVGDPCKADIDCEQGVCNQSGSCANPCQSSSDCAASGATCEQASAGTGACVSSQGSLGSSCNSADDCVGGQCLAEDNAAPVCTRACNATDAVCPGGWDCAAVDGNDVCVAKPLPTGCACTFAKPQRRTSMTWLLSLLTLFAFTKRRGRK